MPLIDLLLPLSHDPTEDKYTGQVGLVNCRAEPLGQRAKSEWSVVAVDGLSTFATLTDSGGVRSGFALTDADWYVVAGRRIFRGGLTGSVSVIGGMPSDGMVTWARNREATPRIAVVCDGLLFYIQAGVATQYTDISEEFRPISVTGLDGYFCFLTATGRHFASEVDGPTISALDSATAEANPDAGVRNFTRGRDLLLFGSRSLEAWTNVGADPYPFQRTTAIDVGCLAGDSVADVDQTCAWVADDGTARVLDGYQAARISTPEVERLIAEDANASSISATSWRSRGRTYYALSGTAWTRVYEVSTRLWHARQSYGLDRWKVSKVITCGRTLIAGHYDEGLAYTLSNSAHDEAGAPLVMTIRSAPVGDEPYRIRHKSLYVDTVPGVGNSSVTDPHLMMRYSDRGQPTGTELTRSLGREAQALNRIAFHGLGSSHSRTYEFSMSAACRRVIVGAKIDAERMGMT